MTTKATSKQSEEDVYTINLEAIATPAAILFSALLISLAVIFGARSSGTVTNSNNIAAEEEAKCDSTAPLSSDCLDQYAQDLELDMDDFAECREENRYADTVSDELAAGQEFGVQGTPSLYVGKGEGDEFEGFYVGAALGIEQLSEIVDYLQDHTAQESSDYWVQIQLSDLKEFELQVKDYYKTAEGGALTGEELNTAVRSVVDDRKSDIETSHNIQNLDKGEGYVQGDGEVVVLEFSDYECPYCQSFASSTLQEFKTDYVETGKARFIFRDFPIESIHPDARGAAEAARCAGEQGKYFEFHDELFGV